MTDADIISLYKDKTVFSWKSIPEEHKQYLNSRFSDSQSYKESVWRILYNIEIRPVCEVCGNPVKFIGRKNNIFAKTCCKECNKKIHEKEKNYTPEEIYYQTLSTNEKIKYTCLKRYGVDHVSKLPSNIFTKNNPNKNQIIKTKIKETRIKKYGHYMSPNNTSALQTNDSKTKRRNSFVQTMIDRYGDEKYRNWEKHRQTCMEKYGVECWQKTLAFKQMLQEKHDIIQNKKYKTQKINHTFNTSKLELESYNIIKSIFTDVVYQYKDKDRYPFMCDFYIPSLDLFIECNYHWTHGGKLFEGTEQDNKIVELWKSKNTKYYNNAIQTWTIRDIKKYEYALKNKLNYLLFYNIDELKKWANPTK